MTEPFEWDELWDAHRRNVLVHAQELDLQAGPFRYVELRLALDSRQVLVAATFLVEFEREVRRAAILVGRPELAWRRRSGGFPRPSPAREGGLEIEQTVPGSLQWVLAPYGPFQALASSDLVQVISTATWLLGGGAKITGWLRRSRDSPESAQPVPEIAVLELPDGARVTIPRGGRLTVRGEGEDRELELTVEFEPQ